MKVVVAQHGHGRRAGRTNHSQDAGGLGTAIHQVPDKPERIAITTKRQLTNQGR